MKNNLFAQQVDQLYAAAARVGDYESVLRAGDLVLVVRHSDPSLNGAWKQFAASVCKNSIQSRAHLRYMFGVLRNVRGRDCVTLLEISCDVCFEVGVNVDVESVGMVS